MSTIFDNVVAFKIIKLLLTPFDEYPAFKLGIIDKTGKLLKKPSTEEHESYGILERLVLNIKRVIAKIPGGDSQLATALTAFYLVKECYINGVSPESINEDEELVILPLEKLTEERKLFELCLEEITNSSGEAVKTTEPVVDKRRKIDSRLFQRVVNRRATLT